MKKLLAIVTISFVLAFSVNAAESPITNEKAIEKLHEFFGLLDIQVYDCTSSAHLGPLTLIPKRHFSA